MSLLTGIRTLEGRELKTKFDRLLSNPYAAPLVPTGALLFDVIKVCRSAAWPQGHGELWLVRIWSFVSPT